MIFFNKKVIAKSFYRHPTPGLSLKSFLTEGSLWTYPEELVLTGLELAVDWKYLARVSTLTGPDHQKKYQIILTNKTV